MLYRWLEYFRRAVDPIARGNVNEAYEGLKLIFNILKNDK